jgi:16S rRNA (uracil1498-N3)-methyltransferase
MSHYNGMPQKIQEGSRRTSIHRVPRLYIDAPFILGTILPLSDPASHYLMHVMRKTKGDDLLVFNGKQGLWTATLMGSKEAMLHHCMQDQPALPLPLCLYFSSIKRQNWLVEKACELGVTHFFPIISQYTMRSQEETKQHRRMMLILQEACEQSQRLHIPHYAPFSSLAACLETLSQDDEFLVLDPYASSSLQRFHVKSPKTRPRGVFIGPEGGWSEAERVLFLRVQHMHSVHLGDAILRSETAALATIAMIQALWHG